MRCIRYDINKYYSAQVHRIIAIRFDWRYHIRRRTIYMYSSLGFTLLASKNPPSHTKHTWDMHKNIEYYYIPTRSLFCIPTTLPSIKRPMMIDIRINLIYVQYQLIRYTSVALSVLMKKGDLFWFGTHITINYLLI